MAQQFPESFADKTQQEWYKIIDQLLDEFK